MYSWYFCAWEHLITTWMIKEKGECRMMRRPQKQGWIFLPWKGCRSDFTTAPAVGREGKELLVKDGIQTCNPDIWHTAMVSEGSCTGRGGWGLFHYSWHPAVLSNWLLCLSPGTVLGDTKDGYPSIFWTWQSTSFLSIVHLKITSIFSTLSNWFVVWSENFRTIHKGKRVHLIGQNSSSKDLK